MKKFLIIVCVIAVIIFLGYIGKEFGLSSIGTNNVATNTNVVTGKNTTSTNNTKNTTENKTQNVNETNTANTVNSVNTTNTTNTTNSTNSTNTTNNVDDNNKTENTTTQQQTENKTVEETTTSNEDIAMGLAKNAYGSSDGVYFKIEQIESNGVYIISVRDAETTSALAWYNVNVNTKTVK